MIEVSIKFGKLQELRVDGGGGGGGGGGHPRACQHRLGD